MVRIVGSGDIVGNDEANSNGEENSASENDRGRSDPPVEHDRDRLSPVMAMNARLLEYGVPSYSYRGFRVEPIHFILSIFAIIFLGAQAVFIIPVLLIITNLNPPADSARIRGRSRGDGTNPSTSSENRDSAQPSPFDGVGHRLGK